MNRIVKAFIISLALSGILLVFFRFQVEKEQEQQSLVIPALRSSASSFSVGATLVISADHRRAYATAEVLKKRMAAIFPRFTIEAKNDSSYALEADGIDDTASLKELLINDGGFQWYEMYSVYDLYPLLNTADSLLHRELIATQENIVPDKSPLGGDTDIHSLLSKKTQEHKILDDNEHPILFRLLMPTPDSRYLSEFRPELGIIQSNDTASLNDYLKRPLVTSRLPINLRLMYGRTETVGNLNTMLMLYAIRKEENGPLLDESYLAEVNLQADKSPNREIITFQFNREGTARWETMTSRNVDKYVAIVNNGTVLFSPRVDSPVVGGICDLHIGGIHRDRLFISSIMKYGALPAPVTIQYLSISLSGFFKYPWVKYLLLGGGSFLVFFALALFIDRALQNAARLSRNTGANG